MSAKTKLITNDNYCKDIIHRQNECLGVYTDIKNILFFSTVLVYIQTETVCYKGDVPADRWEKLPPVLFSSCGSVSLSFLAPLVRGASHPQEYLAESPSILHQREEQTSHKNINGKE